MEQADDICRSYAGHYLSIHPLGNTVLQHLFRLVSPKERLAILNGIAPYLAYLPDRRRTTNHSSHFEGGRQRSMFDKIGNYLCPGIMEYGPELNNFLFEAAMDRLLVIASDRYGARCLLRCLESSKATLYQKKLVATSIVFNSIPLATSSNGALLLTWLLDSSNLPGRYDLISKRFLPHLSHLCNHRIASCSILRIIAQSSEPGASKDILKRMFLSKNMNASLKVYSWIHLLGSSSSARSWDPVLYHKDTD
ncbi:hypothetical protein I308_104201 [Cryptococcus tetragattii IND107]|uniref:PUM-HD domain-containing protein n=1 Tax=Cryptococcus tetragattii IND107 TaxID=1296105 RepID=A0ABR3BPP3_9TREE